METKEPNGPLPNEAARQAAARVLQRLSELDGFYAIEVAQGMLAICAGMAASFGVDKEIFIRSAGEYFDGAVKDLVPKIRAIQSEKVSP